MVNPIVILFFLYFRRVYCENEILSQNIVLNESVSNITNLCKQKKCIPKCCDINEIMFKDLSCVLITDKSHQYHINRYLENIPLYENYYHDKKVNKKLRDVFFLVPRKFNDTIIFKNEEIKFTGAGIIGSEYGFNEYLSEGGVLYMEYLNAYTRWIAVYSSHFCVDFVYESMAVQFFSIIEEKNTLVKNEYYYSIALIISSFFLFLVLLVYTILPELRNLAGLVVMAYVFSLLITFISLASMKLSNLKDLGCIILTEFIYFFFLSSFFWMSVMSYDIWWTFRGRAKVREINRRGEAFTFKMYCIYAWGVPMLMTIGFIIINNMDLSHIPWFIQPQIPKGGCFLVDGQQFVYLYIPVLILIICNWFFYIMTAFNIWRLVRGTNILISAHHSQKNRFVVYLKLSIIMGINWLLEVLGFLTPQLPIWSYMDTYNLFIGFFIFLVLVCKKNIYRKLKARFITSVYVKKMKSSELETNLTQQS